ncbi:hypothetical protein Ancab_018553, partial [Ancistrocladus abbreviatus]
PAESRLGWSSHIPSSSVKSVNRSAGKMRGKGTYKDAVLKPKGVDADLNNEAQEVDNMGQY